jgi:hypothetical protein
MSSVMNVSAASAVRRTPRAYDMRGIVPYETTKIAKMASVNYKAAKKNF